MSAPARDAEPAAHRPNRFTLDRAAVLNLTGGSWQGPEGSLVISGASIDSRSIRRGEIFACLVGANRDGHEHAADAARLGASMILAAKPLPTLPIPVLVVPDVAASLGAIAHLVRLARPAATWIGITGSSGKTTIKELLAAACAQAGETAATQGNLNNHLGVPLTLLGIGEQVRFCAIEMECQPPRRDRRPLRPGAASGRGDLLHRSSPSRGLRQPRGRGTRQERALPRPARGRDGGAWRP